MKSVETDITARYRVPGARYRVKPTELGEILNFRILANFKSKLQMAEYGDEQHAFLVFNRRSKKYREANERLEFLNNRLPEPHFRVCEETLRRVNQWERYQRIVPEPWKRVFNQTEESVLELTKEFLATFKFLTKKFDMWEPEAIEFRCGGVWRKTSVTKLGVDLGIYIDPETDTEVWYVMYI